RSTVLQFPENPTPVHGKHIFKGGVDAQFIGFPWNNSAYPRGYYTYTGLYTGISNVTGQSPGQGQGQNGLGMAQLLLNQENATVQGGINMVGGPDVMWNSNLATGNDRRHYYGAYFQDTWKVRPNVTLNLGLRWEFF